MQQVRFRHRFCVGVLWFCLSLFASSALAQDTQSLTPTQKTQIETVVKTTLRKHDIPGLSVAIAQNNKITYANGFGFSDLENSIPATADTVYRLASISKTVTAVAALQLAEKGQLDLDAPIQKYVPSFPQKQWPITSRHLLANTSGIRHYKSSAEGRITRHYNDLLTPLNIFKDDPLRFEPGTRFGYSSYGFNLLGSVIEGASGTKYVDYIRDNICKPAAMTSLQEDDVYAIIPHRSQGYTKNTRGQLINSPLLDTSYKVPGGGLCGSVQDLAKFAIALQQGLLLKPESLEQMWTVQKTRDGKPTRYFFGNYGLGWGISGTGDNTAFWHPGGQQRAGNFFVIWPRHQMVIVLMCNRDSFHRPMLPLSEQIASILFNNPTTTLPQMDTNSSIEDEDS